MVFSFFWWFLPENRVLYITLFLSKLEIFFRFLTIKLPNITGKIPNFPKRKCGIFAAENAESKKMMVISPNLSTRARGENLYTALWRPWSEQVHQLSMDMHLHFHLININICKWKQGSLDKQIHLQSVNCWFFKWIDFFLFNLKEIVFSS